MVPLFQTIAGASHGGAETFFERLAIALQRAGVEQRLAIRGNNAERANRLRNAGIEMIELPFGGLFDFRTRSALRRAIFDFEPRIVLSWMNRATRLCPPGDYVLAARLGGYYNLKYYKNCDHLVANSRGILEYIRNAGWPEDRVHYLPNFAPDVHPRPVSRARFSTPDDAPLALAIGRLHPNKGFHVLLAALAQLPRWHLWLAGVGPQRTILEAVAGKLRIKDRVHFLGWRDDTAALLAATDLFVCSSRIEPFGTVLLEAWAAEVPVVAAAADGPREIITDGKTGLLVPVENADALARAMQRMIDDAALRQSLKRAGREVYETQFSEARVVELYEEFFESVAR